MVAGQVAPTRGRKYVPWDWTTMAIPLPIRDEVRKMADDYKKKALAEAGLKPRHGRPRKSNP